MQAPADELPFRELVGHLLEFHRRENKPAWWAMFNRQQLSEEELIEDAECIGGLRRDPAAPRLLGQAVDGTYVPLSTSGLQNAGR